MSMNGWNQAIQFYQKHCQNWTKEGQTGDWPGRQVWPPEKTPVFFWPTREKTPVFCAPTLTWFPRLSFTAIALWSHSALAGDGIFFVAQNSTSARGRFDPQVCGAKQCVRTPKWCNIDDNFARSYPFALKTVKSCTAQQINSDCKGDIKGWEWKIMAELVGATAGWGGQTWPDLDKTSVHFCAKCWKVKVKIIWCSTLDNTVPMYVMHLYCTMMLVYESRLEVKVVKRMMR